MKDFFSTLFNYRVKNSDQGWDEAIMTLARTGKFSITSSPTKFEKLIIELCKRIDELEKEYVKKDI